MLTIFGGLAPAQIVQAANTIYDAYQDFSITSNPNGVWSYGYRQSLDQNLILWPNEGIFPDGYFGWYADQGNFLWSVTGQDINLGSIIMPSGFLHVQTGPSGEYSVVRWTAPNTGTYDVVVSYKSLRIIDSGCPADTDVHVLHNSISLYNNFVNGYYPDGPLPFSTTVPLEVNDTIDLAVGPNGSNSCDATGIKATIRLSAIPVSINIDPSSFIPGFFGVTQVAILGTTQMNVNTIDKVSVRFGQNGTEAVPMSSSLRDVNHDGKVDLSFIFKIKDTGIKCFATSAKLTGLNKSGRAIEGSNAITTLGCERCPSP